MRATHHHANTHIIYAAAKTKSKRSTPTRDARRSKAMHKGKSERAGGHVWPKSKGYNPQAEAQTGVDREDSEGKEDEEMRDEEEQVGKEATEAERDQGREEASEGQKEGEQSVIKTIVEMGEIIL